MNNDKKKNVTDKDMQQPGSQQTMQRPRTERGDVGGPDIEDDALIDETTRGDIGGGE